MYRRGGVDGAHNLAGVHVAGVGGVGGDPMVLLDEGVKHVRKHLQQGQNMKEGCGNNRIKARIRIKA